MTRSGFLLGLCSALIAALLLILAYSAGFSGRFVVVALAILAGTIAGILIGRRSARAGAPAQIKRPGNLNDEPAINFSPKLLDLTINEMRDGLLVIDQEMRVVPSNRSARSLFSIIEDSVTACLLTEP